MARMRQGLRGARGRRLEGHAAHERLARHLVDHPDLDGVGREIADDGDHRVGPAPRRQLLEAGARVARPAAPPPPRRRRSRVSNPAEVSSPFSRTSVSTMAGGEFAGRTMMTLAARAAAAPKSPVATTIGERESAHARCRQGARTNARAGPA